MKIEDCTKEELIWLIQYRCFHTAKDFELDVLMHRDEENQKASSNSLDRASSAMTEYINLLKPYEGKPISTVPDSIIHKAAEKMKVRESALKQYEQLEKQYKSIQKRIDEILFDEEADHE